MEYEMVMEVILDDSAVVANTHHTSREGVCGLG